MVYNSKEMKLIFDACYTEQQVKDAARAIRYVMAQEDNYALLGIARDYSLLRLVKIIK